MVVVRSGTDADRRAIHEIHVAAIRGLSSTHYGSDQIEVWASIPAPTGYDFEDDREPLFVAERNGSPVGFAQVDLDRQHFEKLYVRPDHARRGVASRLVERVESAARDAGLPSLTLVASLNALPFYERVGYEGVEATTKTLRTSEGESVEFPCVRMQKRLEAENRE